MVKLVNTSDLKSDAKASRFKSGCGHHYQKENNMISIITAVVALVLSVVFAIMGEYDKATYMVGIAIINQNIFMKEIS